MKPMPCQLIVARKSLSALLSIACGSTIGLCLIGWTALPIGSAVAKSAARPSIEQQRSIHQKLMGTWEVIIPAATSIYDSESKQIIFQSATEATTASYRSKQLVSVETFKYQIVSIRNINSSQLITLKITSLTDSSESHTKILLQLQGDRQLKIENINRRPNTQEFTKAAIPYQKISSSTNIPVLNEIKDDGVPEIPRRVKESNPEQEAIIHRKLTGTWIQSPIKEESAKDIQERVVFRSGKEVESLKYRFGKLSSTNKMSYQIVAVHRTGPSQLITIKIIDSSSTGEKNDPILVLMEFKNDRQLKVGLANKDSTNSSFDSDAMLIDKVSDSTDAPDRIPFKVSLTSIENEALSNVSTIIRAQLAYKAEKGQYAASINQLQIERDLFDQNDLSQPYNYRTTKIGKDRATVVAIPKNKALRSYVALTYTYQNASANTIYETTICKSNRSGRTNLGNPIIVVKGSQRNIQCPRGSQRVAN
jgi:hypothetical protein